jgi:hypothetical protein
VIPDEAVEAAARALWSPSNEGDTWESEHEPYKDHTRAEAKRALEAAAPHLMAAAWERGQADLTHDLFRDQELRKKGGRLHSDDATPNPYRKPRNV